MRPARHRDNSSRLLAWANLIHAAQARADLADKASLGSARPMLAREKAKKSTSVKRRIALALRR